MRSFVDEQIAPVRRRTTTASRPIPQESFDACVKMDLPALRVPEAYGGAGADMVTQAIMAEELARGCASTSVTILISKLGDAAGHELRLRGDQAEVPAAHRLGRDSGELLPVRGGRRIRRRLDALSRGARRRRLHLERFEVLDHQRRGLGHLHRVREHRSDGAHPRHHVFPRREGSGRRVPQARGQDGSSGLARRAKSSSTTCACPRSNRIGDEGEGFKIAMHTLDRSRPTIGAQAVGIAQAAIDYAGNYMKGRKAFGATHRRPAGTSLHAGRHGDSHRSGPSARLSAPAPRSTPAIPTAICPTSAPRRSPSPPTPR